MSQAKPKVAVIIPSWSGDAAKTLASIERQTWRPDVVEVVHRVSPNGRARNVGVARTDADLLVFIDDDAELATIYALESLLRPLTDSKEPLITGAAKRIPPDSSWFQRWVAREVPRIEHQMTRFAVESNPDPPTYRTELTTTCCAMRRVDFDRLGGFDETLIRGVDTEFFVRARRAGCRFLLVPYTWTWHPAPSNLWKLWRKHFLYGVGHAQEVQADPARGRGLQRHPLLYLLFRTLILLPNALIPYSYNDASWRISFRPLKATTSYVSALGYVYGSLFGASKSQ